MSHPLSHLRDFILAAERPTMTLLIGLPGSGKSSWVQGNMLNLTIISSDDILEAKAAAHGLTYQESWKRFVGEAEKQVKADLAAAINRHDHIVVDRTNLSKKIRNKVLSKVPKDYLRFAALFQVDRAILDQRLIERAERTGKIIPAEILEEMIGRFESPTRDEFDEIFV